MSQPAAGALYISDMVNVSALLSQHVAYTSIKARFMPHPHPPPPPPRHRSFSSLLLSAFPTFLMAGVKARRLLGGTVIEMYGCCHPSQLNYKGLQTCHPPLPLCLSPSLPHQYSSAAQLSRPGLIQDVSPSSSTAPDRSATCFTYESPFPPQCPRTPTPSGEGSRGATTALCWRSQTARAPCAFSTSWAANCLSSPR